MRIWEALKTCELNNRKMTRSVWNSSQSVSINKKFFLTNLIVGEGEGRIEVQNLYMPSYDDMAADDWEELIEG